MQRNVLRCCNSELHRSAQFRARADEVRGESLQFKRGELIKFRKRGGQKLLSKHVQRVKKNFSGSRKFFLVPIRVKKIEN